MALEGFDVMIYLCFLKSYKSLILLFFDLKFNLMCIGARLRVYLF